MILVGKTTALIVWIAAAITTLPLQPAAADSLPRPEGRVILTVSGNISKTNNGEKAEFDLDMLHALGTQTLTTTTSWTDGTQEFSGVPMRALMTAVGAEGKMVDAIALNDYKFSIDIEDFSLYPVLLATKLNGKILKIRDKGPLWIVYPLDTFPNEEKLSIERRMIWQLRRMIIK